MAARKLLILPFPNLFLVNFALIPAADIRDRVHQKESVILQQHNLVRHRLHIGDDVVESTTMRLRDMEERRLRKRTRSFGSSPAVGSSRIRIFGSPRSAWAIPTR